MWTKLGSFRERVREHAKSAAQVAQEVLQAAAAEEDGEHIRAAENSHPEQQPQQDDWDNWNKNGFDEDVSQPPPPPDSPPPPPTMLAPPPVPDAPPQPSADVSARKGNRRSRYVVTGIVSSKPQSSALAPPVPTSFVTPAHPMTEQKNGFIAADGSQFVSQQTPPETLSPEAPPPETLSPETPPPETLSTDALPPETESGMLIGTEDDHAAEASKSSDVPIDPEPVSDVQWSPEPTFEQVEQEPQETAGFTHGPTSEEKPPEADVDEFIDWGDDGWNVESDEQMGVQHAADEMYSEDPKPLAQDTGADVEWFFVEPSKAEDNQSAFPPVLPEPSQVIDSSVVPAEAPSDVPDAGDGAQELFNQSISQEREPRFTSPVVPEVQQESVLFEPEVTPTSENSDAFHSDLSPQDGLRSEAKLDSSPFATHDESQHPQLEESDSFWVSNNAPDLAPPPNEPISESSQRYPIDAGESEPNHEPTSSEQERTESQAEMKEVFPVYTESQESNSRSAHEMEALRTEIQRLIEERDKAISAKTDEEHQNEDLKRSILTLKDDLERTQELSETLAGEKESLLGNVEVAIREKQDAEAERDAAIERGGDGIKEAHHLIQVMRADEVAAREREALIAEQIETMRSDIERISSERNSLVHETDDLQRQLQHVKSQAQLQEEQLKQQLQIVSHEREIADLEREKALEAMKVHAQEYESLYADERNRLAALQEKDLRIQELERAVNSREKDKEEEDMRIDLLSNQIQEMKDRTHDVIEERNSFYQEKVGLENEIESFSARHEQVIRDLQDTKREGACFKGERDEARTRYTSMQHQNAELKKLLETLSGERDRLIQERTAAAASSDSVSDREKVLAQECEKKTKSMAQMQRKVTSLLNKIEKLTLQGGAFQRQRDEASARLRSAGEEFMTLHSKLEYITNERDGLKADIARIREERDNANFRAQELSSNAAEHLLVQEKLHAKTEEVDEFAKRLEESQKEVSELLERESSLKQKGTSLASELSQLQGRVEVLVRERDSAISQKSVSEQAGTDMREKVGQLEEELATVGKKAKTLEADLHSSKETSEAQLGVVKGELLAEQKSRQEACENLETLQNEVSLYRRYVSDVHDKIRSSLRNSSAVWEQSPLFFSNISVWPEIPDENREVDPASIISVVTVYAELLSKMADQVLSTCQDHQLTKHQLSEYSSQLTKQAEERESLEQFEGRCAFLEEELASTQRSLQNSSSERDSMRQQLEELTNALTTSKIRESELEEELRVAHETLKMEIEKVSQVSTGEVEQARQELQKLTSSLNTIWGMIQKSLDIEHLETFTDDGSDFADPVQSNIGVHVLRGTASLVAALSRARSHLEESQQRCQNAEKEVGRLTDRAEIAEQERDAFRGSNERLERKAKNSRSEGHEEAKKHYEVVITQMEDELDDLRHNLDSMTDKSERSEKEAGELRALCTKLTSQLNSRTNEVDEAEEKIVYLQDQVTTLGEDLEEAHRRLQEHEEESAVAQREGVERLTSELQEASAELEKTLELCSRLQSTSDEAEAKAKECELLAETHRQAEENLRIAIEQLEAGQDSLVEQRTIELQQKLMEMDSKMEEANERVSSVNVAENKLKIQDEEIKELRGAIGRLADERVELKLELEKSLSRLNHPDAGGQLVDRRVVRQLLVSYFRVGSVRKRDVLELMSRMLAFSEPDNIAVGLKRRALIDRLGSLVQAPELDNASLPPIGTVSDKWIEFLMKETEEGEEQAKGW